MTEPKKKSVPGQATGDAAAKDAQAQEVAGGDRAQQATPQEATPAQELPKQLQEQPAAQPQPQIIVLESEPERADALQGAQQGAWPVVLALLLTGMFSHALWRLSHAKLIPSIKRWLPVAQIALWTLAIVVLTGLILTRLPMEWFYFELVVLAILAALNASWLRSVLSGAALTLEGRFEPGQRVKVGELDGELVAFGMRTVRLRASDGTLHEVPNERLMSEPVANLSGDGSDSACEVEVWVPSKLKTAQAQRLARQAAMLSPLASPRHKPEVFLKPPTLSEPQSKLVIRGFAFDPQYQDHFKSDLVSRVLKSFEEASRLAEGGPSRIN